MLEKVIKLEEEKNFPKYTDPVRFDIDSNFINQMYLLTKEMSFTRDITFFIDPGSLNISDYLNAELTRKYNEYGIYTEDGIRLGMKTPILIMPKEALQNPTEFKAFMSDVVEEEAAEVFDIVIEASKADQRAMYAEALASNPVFAEKLKEFYCREDLANAGVDAGERDSVKDVIKRNPVFHNYKLLNVAPILYKYQCLKPATDRSVFLSCVNKAIEEILSLTDMSTVNYFDLSEVLFSGSDVINAQYASHLRRTLYLKLAGYLALTKGLHFYVENVDNAAYKATIREFYSRNNMYLGDYLNYLKNPIKVGVIQRQGNPAFLYQKEKSDQDEVQLHARVTPLAKKHGELVLGSDECKDVVVSLKNLQIVPITEFFNLHTLDFEVGKAELKKLNAFMDSFQHVLDLKDRSVDCSNTCFAVISGKLMILYVTRLDAKIHYVADLLVQTDSHPMHKVLDNNQLQTLVDVRAFADYTLIINEAQRAKLTSVPNTSDGCIQNFSGFVQDNLTSTSGLYYDSIALWNPVSKCARGGRVSKLVDSELPIEGLRKEFLTFFGGPHPYLGEKSDRSKPTLLLGQSMWG